MGVAGRPRPSAWPPSPCPQPQAAGCSRGGLTHMPQRQDDGVEMTLGDQASDSCPQGGRNVGRSSASGLACSGGHPACPHFTPAPLGQPLSQHLASGCCYQQRSAAPCTVVHQGPRGPVALTPLEAQELGAHVHFSWEGRDRGEALEGAGPRPYSWEHCHPAGPTDLLGRCAPNPHG